MADLCIHAKCEDVSRMIMAKLGHDIPEFRLRRQVMVTVCPNPKDPGNSSVLSLQGRDIEGLPFSFLKEVCILYFLGDNPPMWSYLSS